MRRCLPLALAIPLVLAVGYVHGRWTDRWSPSQAVGEAAAKVGRVPMEFGGWRGRPLELDRETIAQAGIAGYVMRRYENAKTGQAVSILLVCGRPGPIAAHSPEVCYAGAGFEQMGEAVRQTVRASPAAPPAEFLAATFGKPKSADSSSMRILWSWNGGSGWETADNPRLRFARHPNLYKLYVVSERSARPGDDPTPDFLEVLLPALQAKLS